MVVTAVEVVVSMFLMLSLGFLGAKFRFLGDNVTTVLSKVILMIGMPALAISNILGKYTREMLLSSAWSLVVPITVLGGGFLFAGLFAKKMVDSKRQGLLRAMCTFGNSAFIGLPVCAALFGAEGTVIALLYYLVSMLLWWSVGAPLVSKDAGRTLSNPLKRVLTPPLIACAGSLLLVLLGVRLPPFAMRTVDTLTGMVTPVSLLFIGAILYRVVQRGVRWEKGYALVILWRFVIAPGAALLLSLALKLPVLTAGVFLVQAGMPVQTQTCLWAEDQGADAEYAAGGITLTTLIFLLILPGYAWLYGML